MSNPTFSEAERGLVIIVDDPEQGAGAFPSVRTGPEATRVTLGEILDDNVIDGEVAEEVSTALRALLDGDLFDPAQRSVFIGGGAAGLFRFTFEADDGGPSSAYLRARRDARGLAEPGREL